MKQTLVVFLLLAGLGACAPGTSTAPPLPLSALTSFTTVRVTHPDSSRTVLRDTSHDGSTLAGLVSERVCASPERPSETMVGRSCAVERIPVEYALDDGSVARLEVRRGSRARRGLVIGATTAGTLGFFIGYCFQLGNECARDFDDGLAVGLVFGAAGGLIGTALGALFPGPWRRVRLGPTPDGRASFGLSTSEPWR